ncbi:hypothetical protein BJ170DRAFT_413201 [Xylariales sp. AK1849]|nr:hypothetical protein BJ170DRAFT_413201 [Xylariales sp. AK1849]
MDVHQRDQHGQCEFKYQKLVNPQTDIRLLNLKPARDSKQGAVDNPEICCQLSSVALTDALNYTALSYMWGDPRVQFKIKLDGKDFHVGENLYDFLRFELEKKTTQRRGCSGLMRSASISWTCTRSHFRSR